MINHLVRLLFALVIAAVATVAQAQTTRYVHTDSLGSVVVVTDSSRNVIERRDYEPYGAGIEGGREGPAYGGHVNDVATGLVYMQQRYYDAQVGRFLSVDPVATDGNAGGNFNRYKYGRNNPYGFIDPDGRQDVRLPLWMQRWFAGPPAEIADAQRRQKLVVDTVRQDIETEIRTAPQQAKKAGKLVLTAMAFTPFGEVAFAGLEARGVLTAANEAYALGKLTGAASELRVGNRVFFGVSGETVTPGNAEVLGALMGTRNRSVFHGGCSEIACLEKALNAGVRPEGGTMRTVNIGASGKGHGMPKPACSTCSEVLKFFGVGE